MRPTLPRPRFPLSSAPTPTQVEPLPGPDLQDRYDTAWARKPVARWTRIAATETLGRAVVTSLCAPVIHNRDRIADLDGPLIFVANHHSHLDTSLVQMAIPRRFRHRLVVAGAADYFFDTRPKAVINAWAWGAIPMERHRVSRRSAIGAADLLDDGWSLAIFPEGGRSPDGWGQAHKGGAAYLACRCGVSVVPIFIDGTDRVLPKGSKRPEPRRVHLSFGEPLSAEESEDPRKFAERIEAAMEMIADERQTDWYTARLRAHAGHSPSMRGPDLDSWRRSWSKPATEIDESAKGLLGRLHRTRKRQKRQW